MIPYGRHSISNSDYRSIKKVMKSDWLTIGPKVEEFEYEIKKVINADCFVVSSGTAALHCAYAAIEIQPGDEIISSPLTFIATHSTAMQFGAKIVFADIDEKTGNLDPRYIENLISPRTKAITTIDYAGHPSYLDELSNIAKKYNLYLIEDAAHSFGTRYKGRAVGSIADLTTFSFFPTKNLTTGEGGAVSSNNQNLLDKARKFGRQGLIRDPSKFKSSPDGPWHQEVQSLGLNYRLPDILCALGISQIKKIHNFQRIRSEIFATYSHHLSLIENLKLPYKEVWAEPFWHLYPLRVPSAQRNLIFNELRNAGIGVQVNYVPSYSHPIYKELGYKKPNTPISEKYYSEEISLPIHVNLKKKDLHYVISKIKELVSQ